MAHRHAWKVSGYVLLGMPTPENYGDRFTRWHCQTCPRFCWITGEVKLGTPLSSPEAWDRLTQTAAYQRSAYAQEAARQAHWRPK